ncbi:aldehyde dehydrogenase family protein [Alteromonas oceanisediminis]|uniref:aldehyde dehydrogenase family protein n=1 Tax=Alteromonas oceanisediminis TaxID=2836180 RepID=UPI001BDAB31F|nr:aldehyde dehydrogenase family protein [Alteromonas oceanisediminis]MBT0585174.1 aldehyde dehydrogenase family protein [Alteromonas oceanisediminis]
MTEQTTATLFIDNKWCCASDGDFISVVNPVTEQTIAHVSSATKEDVNKAVDSADKALKSDWYHTNANERAEILEAIANGIEANITMLSELETKSNGKPLAESVWDIEDAAGCFRYYAKLARGLDDRQGKSVTLPDINFKCRLFYEPIGVCALIIPWNFPLLMAAWKVAPALAAGCTMVLKPSEFTPLTAIELCNIIKDAGVPSGVVNLITGFGHTAGQALVEAKKIRKIAFTGSDATGATVMKSAAVDIKNVALELGGKSPILIFDDVDVDKAVEWIMFGIFWNKGEVCSATSRLIVHERIKERLFDKLAVRANSIAIGDGMHKSVKLGPLVSKVQYKKVTAMVREAIDQGATLIFGGKRPKHLEKGYFFEPTLLVDEKRSSCAWTKEIFGPVLTACTFSTEEEAVRIANDSEFGLGAAVLSQDPDLCQRVAGQIESGIVWINCSQPTFTEAPWGGVKRSGIGRELAENGLENFLETKQVTEYVGDDDWDWYK